MNSTTGRRTFGTSERLRPFGESVFATISRLAAQHGAVNLGQGFPNFDGPQFVKDAGMRAIAEGHRAEKLRPGEQLVHTNLSLFYMKSGDKKTAEHHGLQARIASWRGNMDKPAAPGADPGGAASAPDSELKMAEAPAAPVKLPTKFPEQPWKKKPQQPPSSPS